MTYIFVISGPQTPPSPPTPGVGLLVCHPLGHVTLIWQVWQRVVLQKLSQLITKCHAFQTFHLISSKYLLDCLGNWFIQHIVHQHEAVIFTRVGPGLFLWPRPFAVKTIFWHVSFVNCERTTQHKNNVNFQSCPQGLTCNSNKKN